MATNTQPTEAPDKTTAYRRLAKSILRRRAVDQLVNAIKRDLETLPKTDVMAQRSRKVLDYMRGYIGAVEDEQATALAEYEEAVYLDKRAVRTAERKSSLGRAKRPINPNGKE